MSDGDELDRLAARGRELREREEASNETMPIDETAAARRRVVLALSPYARGGWWILGSLGGAGLFALVSLGKLSGWTGQDDVMDVVCLFTCGAALLVCYVARGWMGERALRHENAWVRSLPFPLAGYPAALGTTTTEGRFVVDVTFAGPDERSESAVATFRTAVRASADIDDTLLSDVLRTARATVQSGSGALDRRIETTFDFGQTSVSTNAHVRAWIHGLAPALVAIHARHPIARARVRGFAS